MGQDPHNETERRKELVALMTQHQRRIFSYIYTLVPNRYDAEDLLQETSVVICEKFDEFEPQTDFVAWACQIAYWRIRYLFRSEDINAPLPGTYNAAVSNSGLFPLGHPGPLELMESSGIYNHNHVNR